jgi:hypothetical protein
MFLQDWSANCQYLTSANIKWSMSHSIKPGGQNKLDLKQSDRLLRRHVEGFVQLVIFPLKIRTRFTITDDTA